MSKENEAGITNLDFLNNLENIRVMIDDNMMTTIQIRELGVRMNIPNEGTITEIDTESLIQEIENNDLFLIDSIDSKEGLSSKINQYCDLINKSLQAAYSNNTSRSKIINKYKIVQNYETYILDIDQYIGEIKKSLSSE